MTRVLQALHRFFFPPAASRLWIRVLSYATLGLLTLAVLISGAYASDGRG